MKDFLPLHFLIGSCTEVENPVSSLRYTFKNKWFTQTCVDTNFCSFQLCYFQGSALPFILQLERTKAQSSDRANIKHPLNLCLCFCSLNCFWFIRSHICMQKNFPDMCIYSKHWECSWVIPGFSKCTEEFRILGLSDNQCSGCSLVYAETFPLHA